MKTIQSRKTFFNRIFINGFISNIICSDKRHKIIKLLISSTIEDINTDNCIEAMIFKKTLIDTCDSWFKIKSPIILEGSIVVSINKSSSSKNMMIRKQIIKVEKILLMEEGIEYY